MPEYYLDDDRRSDDSSGGRFSVKHAKPRAEVRILKGDDVADHWADFGPWIMSTMEYDLEPIDDVQVMQNLRADAWICLAAYVDGKLSGIAVCALAYMKSNIALEVKALAGDDFDVWINAIFYALKDVGHSHRCRKIFLRGRRGWERRIRAYGFRHASTTMVYDLDGVN